MIVLLVPLLLQCGVGTWWDGSECVWCPDGQYQDLAGQSTCKQCPAGSTTSADVGYSQCEKCGPGTYQPKAGQGTCLTCVDGMYQDNAGQTGCKPCPAGSFSYSDSDYSYTESCTACPKGTYQPKTGQAACLLCPDGQYQGKVGQTKCLPCPAGSYSKGEYASDTETCTVCDKGMYQPKAGQDACLTCPFRKYTDRTGGASCKVCGAGRSWTTTSCTACRPGQALSVQQAKTWKDCDICGLASYQPKSGQQTCVACPKSTATFYRAATTPKACKRFLPGECPPWWLGMGLGSLTTLIYSAVLKPRCLACVK
jgi:hypothetical protein